MTQPVANSDETRASELLDSLLPRREQNYYQARSLEEAVGLLGEYGKEAKIVAGGVDILSLIKSRVFRPHTLISLKNIPGLRFIDENENGLSLGPLTLIDDLQNSSLIKSRYPALFEVACSIASPQVRNMGTVGGNLCQEVRCWYFRRSPDTGIAFDCRRKHGNGRCYARDGENQYHAIMASADCCAVCPSDLASALSALDARVEIRSALGERSLSVDDLYSPRACSLLPGEIISAIRVPPAGPDSSQNYLKFRTRKAIDFAIVSVASSIKFHNGVVRVARLVMGGVSYRPHRLLNAEEFLKGRRLNEKVAVEASQEISRAANPLSKNSYKVDVAEALVKRALLASQKYI
jgi:xanthine dehydrogenase YagS FAD-binding subunit